jgi:hypothetical protein
MGLNEAVELQLRMLLSGRWMTIHELVRATARAPVTIAEALESHPLADWRMREAVKTKNHKTVKEWTLQVRHEKH